MKKNVSKKQIALILVAVCLVGLIGIGVSYSYFLANISTSKEENKNSNISTTTITQVVMDMQGKISSDGAYPGHKMVKEVVVRGIGADDATPANASIQITPDLGDFANDVVWKLYKSDTPITCISTKHVDGGQFYEEASCNTPSSAVLMLEGGATSSFKNIVVNPNTETKYYLVIEYANKENQSSQMGKSFSIDIGLGEKRKIMSEKIAELAMTDTINLASDDPGNNVRYIGANPSNYVYFNCSDYNNQSDSTCEKWRIIGVFNNVTKSDGSKENLVKIIRDKRIDDIAWDSNGVNDWSTATLQQNLNSGTYYTTTLKNDTTRNAIEEVVWNLGGTDNHYSSASNGLASHWYGYERGTTVYSGRPTTWTGKIGLMYPSDYGYATSGGTTKDRATCLAKKLYNWDASDFSDCKGNDYLYNSSLDQLTLAPSSADTCGVFYVLTDGSVGILGAFVPYAVRPALFLKSSISVDLGTGESSNPYRLSVN